MKFNKCHDVKEATKRKADDVGDESRQEMVRDRKRDQEKVIHVSRTISYSSLIKSSCIVCNPKEPTYIYNDFRCQLSRVERTAEDE